MLLFDDSNGTSGIKEASELRAMLRVGNEFMTYADDESLVQRSGEFVRIEKKQDEEVLLRFLLLHETSDVSAAGGAVLTDGEYFNATPGAGLAKRTLFFTCEASGSEYKAFKPARGAPELVRSPRYTRVVDDDTVYRHPWMLDSNFTAISGVRRIFPDGDGNIYLVRDVEERGGRYYYGSAANGDRVRSVRVRAITVAVIGVDPFSIKRLALNIPLHGGLGKDVTGLLGSNANPGIAPDYADDTRVYYAAAGTWWGENPSTTGTRAAPRGGDHAAQFALAEPAVAKDAGGKTYTAIVAVFAGDDDVSYASSSAAYRLTCRRTLPTGGTADSKVTFPALSGAARYVTPRAMTLHRHSPAQLSLRVLFGTSAAGHPSDAASPLAASTFVLWSGDNGATWSAGYEIAGFVNVGYGGALVAGKDALLLFQVVPETGAASSAAVIVATPSGQGVVGTVYRSTLLAGLFDDSFYGIPFVPRGFGGVVYRSTPSGRVKRQWMQYDPVWIYDAGTAQNITYPGARPCLVVSEDNGATWQRRFLPTEWGFRAGFVVSISPTELAMPVLAARSASGASVPATVYVSSDGGDSWKPTGAKVTLPGVTRVDGNIVVGQVLGNGPPGPRPRQMQDISDAWTEYNPGELHPLIALRDKDGKPLNSNPARPWMVDARIQEPTNG